MTGHVFVVLADITALECDAWLLPGHYMPGPTWIPYVGDEPREVRPADWGHAGSRVMEWRALSHEMPPPYLVDVGGSRGTPIA